MSESIFADRTVQNLLDTDLYKLTMMQAVLHNYPNAEVGMGVSLPAAART
jgi:nicotinate phosphoribosyltransferase